MQENWLWGFDQFINDITTTRGESVSTLSTKYVYEIVHDFLDADLTKQEMEWELSRFMDELARIYKKDTNKLIGEEV
jgi:hypothetical protein